MTLRAGSLRNKRSRPDTAYDKAHRLQFMHRPEDCHPGGFITPDKLSLAWQPLPRLVSPRMDILLDLFENVSVFMVGHRGQIALLISREPFSERMHPGGVGNCSS